MGPPIGGSAPRISRENARGKCWASAPAQLARLWHNVIAEEHASVPQECDLGASQRPCSEHADVLQPATEAAEQPAHRPPVPPPPTRSPVSDVRQVRGAQAAPRHGDAAGLPVAAPRGPEWQVGQAREGATPRESGRTEHQAVLHSGSLPHAPSGRQHVVRRKPRGPRPAPEHVRPRRWIPPDLWIPPPLDWLRRGKPASARLASAGQARLHASRFGETHKVLAKRDGDWPRFAQAPPAIIMRCATKLPLELERTTMRKWSEHADTLRSESKR